MRLFLPYTLREAVVPQNSVRIEAGRMVWGVPDHAASGADEREEREFEALSEALLVTAPQSSDRILVLAVDAPDNAVAGAASETTGEWALEITQEVSAAVKAYLVSELTGPDLVVDEYAPEVLWFDPSEGVGAAAYAAGQDAAAS